MTKRITTSKRDREKLKQQKREEKQKRKDERASLGTASFDDMIAYVDENGMLHSTPPETPKAKIELEDIVISTPKQEARIEEPMQGRVEYFNTSKGFGFIRDKENGEKYFFHISSAPDDIAEGNEITYELERGTQGMNAVRISIITK